MGTHAAVIIYKDGRSYEVERTFDGSNIIHYEGAIYKASLISSDALKKLLMSMYYHPDFGSGMIEYDDEREHGEFACCLEANFDTKTLSLSWLNNEEIMYLKEEDLDEEERNLKQRLNRLQNSLKKIGWRLVV